jgi:hypothetical protein
MSDITPLPTPPSTSDPVNFATRADDFLGALPDFADEMNAYGGKLNSFSTNSTSTTSLAVGTGSKSLTVTTGKSYVTGMYIRVVSTSTPTNYMQGTVTSYNSGTGALVFTSEIIGGTGTIASWTISMTVNPKDRPAGTVLQVVQATYSTEVVISTSTFTDSGLSASITPSSTSSKILIMVSQPLESFDDSSSSSVYMRILGGATPIYTATSTFGQFSIYALGASEISLSTIASVNYLDSPATASAITYKTQFNCSAGSVTLQSQSAKTATMILMEIAG